MKTLIKQELLKDTETPETNCVQIGDTVACAHCQPEKGYDTMEKYGLECDCNCHKKQPESSWEEEGVKRFQELSGDYSANSNASVRIVIDELFHKKAATDEHAGEEKSKKWKQDLEEDMPRILKILNEDASLSDLKLFCDKVVSEAEKRGFNLALEEAKKFTIELTENDWITDNLIEKLRLLKK